MNKVSRNGFTVIELMVLLVIIGALLSIAIPSMLSNPKHKGTSATLYHVTCWRAKADSIVFTATAYDLASVNTFHLPNGKRILNQFECSVE
jgi:prepilin-type N-terminal cleavage/methylation domain-containing protein